MSRTKLLKLRQQMNSLREQIQVVEASERDAMKRRAVAAMAKYGLLNLNATDEQIESAIKLAAATLAAPPTTISSTEPQP